jgi:hypothetical protein
MSLVLREALLAVKVAAHRVAVLNFNLGMILAKELFRVEHEISCKLKFRRRIFLLYIKLAETHSRVGV